MKLIPLLLFFVFSASVSQADLVRVSAGEHSSFTRIVLDFNNRPRWKTESLPTGQRIMFQTETAFKFDLSRVFRTIGRQRLGDIRPYGYNGLELDVVCDCVTSFEVNGTDVIVIDIRDEMTDQMPAPTQTDAATAVPETLSTLSSNRNTPTTLPQPWKDRIIAGGEREGVDIPSVLGELSFSLPEQDQSVAVELLGRALSRAAAQGLIAASPDSAPRSLPTRSMDEGSIDTRSNVSVTTGIDLVVQPFEAIIPPTDNGTVCLSDSQVAVASWGNPNDMERLGELRTAAVAESGDLDPAGAADLARFYVSLSFGAEAAVVASMLPDTPEREIIEAFADIMDWGQTESSVFDGQVFCEGEVALWAILAAPIGRSDAPETPNHILATFSALPAHLRSHLGPLVSERLRAAGLESAARTSINAVTRGGKKTEESTLAIARLDLSSSRAEAAREVLSDLSNGTDLTAAEALLELMRDAENRGMAPNPSWVEDAPTLVGALEGTDIATDLNLAGLRGLIALGRYNEFRAALIEDTPGLNSRTRKSLAIRALAEAAKNADSLQFVKAEIGLANVTSASDFSSDERLAIAQRLLDLGFPDRSLRYFSNDPESLVELEARSEALITGGKADEAIRFLESSALPGTQNVLGRAFVASGLYDEALSTFEMSGEVPEAISAALRIGNWSWIAEIDSPELSEPVATLIEPISASSINDEAPNGQLIDASRTRRRHVESILNATSLAESDSGFTN